jgi:hypothetical protein
MSISRLLSLSATVALVVLGIFAIGTEITTSNVASNSQEPSDDFQRHPGASVAVASADLSDYYLRHRGSASPAATEASDWFERHPESLKASSAVDLSDYYQRHRSADLD